MVRWIAVQLLLLRFLYLKGLVATFLEMESLYFGLWETTVMYSLISIQKSKQHNFQNPLPILFEEAVSE